MTQKISTRTVGLIIGGTVISTIFLCMLASGEIYPDPSSQQEQANSYYHPDPLQNYGATDPELGKEGLLKDKEGLAGDTSFIQFLSADEVKTSFQDVGGLIELKEEVKELVDFLKNPEKFQALGAEMPKGILMIGSPGSGKTLIARAIAGEANIAFLSVSGSDFQNGWIGTGAWRVKKLFEKARQNAPAIIFIDEIDSLLAHRKYAGLGGEQEYVAAVNQFLAELDGIDRNKNSGIVVMGATNQMASLDKAATRAGRFDRHLFFNLPTQEERVEILNIISKKLKLANSVNLRGIAQTTIGFSGADLKNIMNEAAIHAARENKSKIDNQSIHFARDKILLGKQRPALSLNEKQKKIVAYHEAGHALIGHILKLAPIEKISIIPRGKNLGVTLLSPKEDHILQSKDYYEGTIAQALGGYVSESLIFGESKITEGSEDDLRKATELAYAMVTRWGFSSERGPIYQLETFDSVATESEVQKMIKKQQALAKNLLEKNIEKLHQLAKALIKEESLSAEQINNILN